MREPKVRVTFFLPNNNQDEEDAVSAVVRYLKRQQTAAVPITGFTCSNIDEPGFTGTWWDGNAGNWVEDQVVYFIVDFPGNVDDVLLDDPLARLHKGITRLYAAVGRPQKEVWVIAHGAVRHG